MNELLTQMAQDLYNGKVDIVREEVKKALASGLSAKEVLEGGLVAGMDLVGKDFKAGIRFIPEVLISAKAMKAGMEIIKPLLTGDASASVGKIVIGTVAGDLHDIGKNLVGMMMQGAGMDVVDLGTDVPPASFVEAVKAQKPDIVGMSALLTTTMAGMKRTIEALEEAGIRQNVKIMVGGAPVTDAYAKQIGADGYAPDAAAAVDVARVFLR
jgi:5-methyltetrahydrofolate--homocysteine methyltransferase